MNQAEIKRRQAQAIAAILGLAALAVTARLTGYNGVTYVLAALEVYALFDTVVSGGIFDALGRILRLRNAKGQYKNAVVMRRNAILFQGILGLIGAAAVLMTAEEITAKVFRIHYSSSILMILAPAVFLRAVSSVLQGYSRGEGAELPTAAASILRQLFIIGFSVIFCNMLGNYGSKVSRLLVQTNFTAMYGGVGVAVAVTLSEVFVVLFLALTYRGNKKNMAAAAKEGMRTTDSPVDSIRILCAGRGMSMLTRLLIILPLPLGLIFFSKASEGSDSAMTEYGVFAAGFGLCCGVIAAVVMILLLPVCGKMMNLFRKEEGRYARQVFQCGVHLGIVHAAFWTVFIAVMAEPVAAVFCGEQAQTATKLFRGGSGLILLFILSYYFAKILILMGKKLLVLGAVAAADVFFIIFVTVSLNTGKAGILSLIYGALVGMGVLSIVLGTLAYRQLKQKMDWLHALIVPAGVASVAGLAGMLLEKLFTAHLGNLVSLIVCLAVTGAFYWATLILLRNFREQELESIPGGKLIGAIGQLLRVY